MISSLLKDLKSVYQQKLPQDRLHPEQAYGRFSDNAAHVWPSITANWKKGALAVVLMFTSSLLSYPGPMITRYLVDDVLMNRKYSMLAPVLALIAAVGAMSYVSSRLQSFVGKRFSQEVTIHLQQKVLRRVLSLPKSFFDHIQKGYLMSRLTSDIGGVNWFISGMSVQAFVQSMKLCGGIMFLLYLEWRIAVPVILSLPVPFILSRFFMRRSYVMGHANGERVARYSAVFQEIFNSIPLIKAFAKESNAEARLIGEMRENYRLNNAQALADSVSAGIMSFTPVVARFLVLAFGSYWVIKGEWSIGSLLAFQMYLGYVYGPSGYLSSAANQFQQARASLERVASILNKMPEDNYECGIEAVRLDGPLEFRNVRFSYHPGEIVLRDISFVASPGEHWAIVGPSGIGKTTLASLIMRLYKPDEGEILFNGVNASAFNVRSLRRRMGYVPQKNELVSGTILDNLRYGNEEASPEDAAGACRIAGIHEFIETLPSKYKTGVEECGANLSEGQKQRISIARALLKKPDILILDEPTSSLDNQTEEAVCRALPEAMQGVTIFTIAHRLSTIRSADRIIFLRRNLPPLTGRHEELETHKDYREFFRLKS